MHMRFSQPVSIAVCDDETEELNKIAEMTTEVLEAEGISSRISAFCDGGSLLEAVENGEQYEILLLDVMMEQMDGIELASALQRTGNEAAVIFISCNRDMALLGYEVSAIRYLAKPVQKEKLKEALLYCCRLQPKQKEILLQTKRGQSRILVSDILYIESWDRGTRLILQNGDCKARAKLSELEKMLPKEKFVCCHRTLLVNLAFIQSVRYCELTLKNGQILPVSKYRQAQLKEKLLCYLRG